MRLRRGRALALFVAAGGIAACHDWSSLSSQYGSDSGSGAPVCVAFVVTGDTGTCARRSDGSLLCWGDNRYGQLGVGDEATHDGPQEVIAAWPGVAKVYLPSGTGDLTASQSVFACSIDTSAGFWCWGDNTFGQLGDGTMTQHPSPTRVTALQNDAGNIAGVQRACVGASHTCAVTSDGNIWCWGNNASGQLGTGDTMSRSMPTRIDNSMLGTQITSLQCGAQHTCAVTGKPALWCWGSNAYGQLGVGDTMDRSTPTQVKLPTTVGRVGTGGTYTCAYDTLGAVWCWGNGASGQLGTGNTSNQPLPVQVQGLPKVNQVWTGGAHTCVLDTTNSLWCWGDNQYGQLGTGDTTMHSTPFQPTTVPAQKVAGANAGGDHTCAVLLDGSVVCWGNDQYGQLGVPMQTGQAAVQVEPHCP